MKVVMFTEAGYLYGYGHLMRCLALAEGFREKSFEVIFIVRGEGNFSTLLSGYNYELCDWFDFGILNLYVKNNCIAIVDSYYTDENLCRFIYKKFDKVLFFDDTQRINYPGGFVLNGVIGAEKMNYPSSPLLSYLLGSQFQSLRKEFWDVPGYTVRENIENILITFGGSDITNETPTYMEKLRKMSPDSKISVVIGHGFKNIENIKSLKDYKIELHYTPDAQEMMNLMFRSDIAVSAAGQTISELARVGTPTIGIQVVENQKNNIRNWYESGFLLSKEVLNEQIPFDLRRKSSDMGREIIDGLGVKRIVEKLSC